MSPGTESNTLITLLLEKLDLHFSPFVTHWAQLRTIKLNKAQAFKTWEEIKLKSNAVLSHSTSSRTVTSASLLPFRYWRFDLKLLTSGCHLFMALLLKISYFPMLRGSLVWKKGRLYFGIYFIHSHEHSTSLFYAWSLIYHHPTKIVTIYFCMYPVEFTFHSIYFIWNHFFKKNIYYFLYNVLLWKKYLLII